MKKLIIILIAFILGWSPLTKADEGMWLPLFIERLNYVDMQAEGLQLTAEEIYSVNNSSLKDAIAIFGRGCTSEIISDQGLLLTNHHCGYGRIQAHSSVEHDYLSDGFWAQSFEEELPNEGLSVQFLIRIEDVSEEILAELNEEMTEEERRDKINEIANGIEEEATNNNHYDASVRSFFAGNEFYLFVYEKYTDVRFVGAPPSSIGKYGADTDNWMWPRHTGDFSLFRVYTDKEGKPADYSEENIPLKPKHHLPVSLSGVEKGDFSMILGYPGGTDRYMTSYGVKMALDITNMTIVNIRDKKLKIMMEDMQADPAVRIKYASKYARTSNYWKYFIGQTKQLKHLRVVDQKEELETSFTNWVNSNESNKQKFGDALNDIEAGYKKLSETELASIYLRESISRGSEILGLAMSFSKLSKELAKKDADQEKIDKMVTSLKDKAAKYFKDYNAPTDQKLLSAMLDMYYKNVPANQQPEYFKRIASKYKGDFEKYAQMVFDKSNFATPEKVDNLLAKPSAKTIDKDPALALIQSFYDLYYGKIYSITNEANEQISKGDRLFIAGLREMQPNKKFYPDANFTMRLTYGKVLDYYPADAVHYNYYTTLEGVMAKEDPSNWEFVVPEKLKELYQNKDYGQYGEGDVMKVCFLTNHDITGGNSGSPVINGKGELIGLAFDGNWEAMSGDIAFEPNIQRTINVDIRYVLFIIDKYAGATRLVDEMTLVKNRPVIDKEKRDQAVEVEVEEISN